MLCPLCNIEMRIANSRLEFTGDTSPEAETKAIQVMDLQCRNEKCKNYNQTVQTVSAPLN